MTSYETFCCFYPKQFEIILSVDKEHVSIQNIQRHVVMKIDLLTEVIYL